MSKGLEEAKSALSKAKDEYTLYYNRRREPAPELQPGDHLYDNAPDPTTPRPSVTLHHRRRGPYPIEARVGHGGRQPAGPPSRHRQPPEVHIVKLTLATPDPI